MFILVIFAVAAYLAIGLGFTVLSLHELATRKRDRLFNRLMAWSGVALWLPTLFVVAVCAFYASLRSTQFPLAAKATRPTVGLSDRHPVRQV